jgi:AmmeMemoRadiSam system protein B
MSTRVERPPAVAGLFYPASRRDLEQIVTTQLADAAPQGPFPKALIVPHAGYVYSGPVAASGYRCLEPFRDAVERVVLVGPTHRVAMRGLGVSGAEAFRTPLGRVPLALESVQRLETLPQVTRRDDAHGPEHSLEVHLPFLQVVLGAFSLVPILTGKASADDVADALDVLWGGDETVIVVSTDLSHYHDYETACALDLDTSRAIETFDERGLAGRRACGYVAVRGLLRAARRREMSIRRLDLRNSGDTAGPRDQVVGYGAWALTEPAVEGADGA